jgi:hypothetical protein
MKQKHELKTWPMFFEAVRLGVKNFEVRENDRGFEAGDTLLLKEWEPMTKKYTGRYCERYVTYVLPGGNFGVAPNFCVMGIVPL